MLLSQDIVFYILILWTLITLFAVEFDSAMSYLNIWISLSLLYYALIFLGRISNNEQQMFRWWYILHITFMNMGYKILYYKDELKKPYLDFKKKR
jgi:hypothetical protein